MTCQTTCHASVLRVLLLAALFSVFGFAPKIHAQSDADLRRENQRLQTQVREMAAELEAARKTIQTLEARIKQLEAQPSQTSRRSTPQPVQPEPVTVDESKPEASPRALFRHLQENYVASFDGMSTGAPGSRERTAYMRAVDAWVSRVNREFKGQINWHVKLDSDSAQVTKDGANVMAEAVDPVTGTVLGEPFEVQVRRPLLTRLRMLNERGQADVLLIRGALQPTVGIDAQRETPGAFDNPKLIGAFAEFGFNVVARSFEPPAPPKEPPSSP